MARELPRILVHDGHFETADGKPFVPQGVNWVIVSPGDIRTSQNISFNPGYYERHRADIHDGLRRIAAGEFNVVRVRLDALAIAGGEEPVILDPAYMAEVVDFIRAAADQGLYTELTGQWLPSNYYQLVSREGWPDPNRAETSGINNLLLSGGLAGAYGRYIADVLKGIAAADPALLSAVFGVDLWNELAFEADKLPFSRRMGGFHRRMGVEDRSGRCKRSPGPCRRSDGTLDRRE